VLESNWSDAQVAKGGTPPNRPENALPDWARHPAPRRGGAPGILSPSGLGGAHVLPGGSEDEGPGALARGEAIHLLLEILTRVPQADWAATATRVLAGIACDAEGVLAEATGVLAAPELAFVFGEGSLAEVEVTAALSAAGGRLLGRIDRLVVEADRVLAVDFKSNRALPATAHAVPEAILRQMGAYRACLTQIWPDRAVATAVLWTAEPSLMHLPDEIVDAALGRVLLDPLGRRA
jgi:ATP-dependent helicase/nuclease subunit A